MTERSDHDDELVSAAIDGEASADEAARVASDPVLQARRTALESAVHAVGAPVEPSSASARDEAIAAALAAFDASAGTDDRDRDGRAARVLDLRSRRPSPWVAVAAIALAVVAAGALLLRVRDTSTTTTASRQVPSTTLYGAQAPKGAAGAVATGGSGSESYASRQDSVAAPAAGAEAATVASVTDLGSFATADDLTAAVRARLEPGAEPTPTTAAPFSCPPPAELTSVQLVASATLAERPLLIFAGTTVAQGGPAYIAVDATCTAVLEQQL